ncbi:MAG: EAL domain-containing protein [Rhizobiales bacterium]|nr:EAL domain-containing protein [Hyphomicrobiales bacterium]
MSVITAALGGYATLGIKRAGGLVTKTFDESLMSINYARAAAADFATMQSVLARRSITDDATTRQQLDQRITTLNQSLSDDLTIAAERSQSKRASHAAANVQRAVTAWNNLRLLLIDSSDPKSMWDTLDHYATIVDQQIDLLINYTAGDGFTYRQSARAAVASDMHLNLIGTALAIMLSALVTWLLARRIIGPVAVASGVAERIAHGKLDGIIPRGGADELGALLSSMSTMRDNIKTMMDREVAQRRSAQARLADALESSREGIVVVDAAGQVALANSQAADFLGGSDNTLQPGSMASELATTDWAKANNGKAVSVRSPSNSSTGEVELPDGRWLRVSRSTTQEGGFIVVCSDITVQKEQEARLTETNLRLDAALDNMSQGLCLYDSENRLQVVNRRFCEIFHLAPESVRPGMSFEDVLGLSVTAGNHGQKRVEDIIAEQSALMHQRETETHFQDLSDGRAIAIAHRHTSDGGWVATYEDVTERRHAEAQIVFMARHDTLTRLPNRVLLNERIEQAVTQLGRGSGLAVLCVDLDNFKQVNDTLGHPVGDALLVAVSERLQACVREVDTVARLGGDEFAIVQCGIGAPEDAALLARRVVETLSAPYEIDGHRVMVGASLGISVAPGDGVTCERLLKNADVALYRAKSDGRGTWRFFEPEMDARLQARRKLELDLREALAKNQFDLYYQPICDLELNRVCGFEALLRWRHPTRGFVPPSEFIPVAEEIGLIVQLGDWVLRRACAQASEWPSYVKVAVNVSPAQFKGPGLVQSVSDALSASGLSPQRLELEITESVLLTNSVATLAIRHALRDRGIRISMDDFGTGYSSLSYLRSFPFDKIKIDQSFVRDVAAPGESSLIVRAIIGLSRSLGMRTTAEGVETEEQLARLRAEGCNEVQGYLFGMPSLPRHIPKLLKRNLVPRSPADDADAGEISHIAAAS